MNKNPIFEALLHHELKDMLQDKVSFQAEKRAIKARAKAKDRRRVKGTAIASGRFKKKAKGNPKGTIFRHKVQDPTDTVLKDGAFNSKIGGDVSVGWLRGARIFTLTLEERATCPRSCLVWNECYGNSMQHASRYRHGPELEKKILQEIEVLSAAHKQVLIRLHVLGDFYSLQYVDLWELVLREFPNVAVFGFTAHQKGSVLGDRIAQLRERYRKRFSIRHSGFMDEWGAFVYEFEPLQEVKKIGTAIVCPEQREAIWNPKAKRHCGNCGVCWTTSEAIAFSAH